jgi:hypothetical protein
MRGMMSNTKEAVQRRRKGHLKGLEVTVPGAHTALGIVPLPISPSGKSQDLWRFG